MLQKGFARQLVSQNWKYPKHFVCRRKTIVLVMWHAQMRCQSWILNNVHKQHTISNATRWSRNKLLPTCSTTRAQLTSNFMHQISLFFLIFVKNIAAENLFWLNCIAFGSTQPSWIIRIFEVEFLRFKGNDLLFDVVLRGRRQVFTHIW